MRKKGVSVILLNWNGIELLKEVLPRLYAEILGWTIPHELIFVDNGSKDGSVEYVKAFFTECLQKYNSLPACKIKVFPKNLGFAKANNRAVRDVQYDAILFINNDIYFEKGFIEPLFHALEDESIFAAAPKMLRWDKKTIDDGLRFGNFHSGLFSVELEANAERFEMPHYVTFFCGGCFLCKKNLFLEFDGFDELYTPYAWEDLDLGYRSWKRGYKVVYVPEAVAYHKREATTRTAFSNIFFISLMWKNKFIFMWKNITSLKLFANHLFLLPAKLVKFLFNGRWRYVVGFFRALPYVPIIIWKRFWEVRRSVLTDEEVLHLSYSLR